MMEKLVHQQDEKNLIQGLVKYTSGSIDFDDFVPGKGNLVAPLFGHRPCEPPNHSATQVKNLDSRTWTDVTLTGKGIVMLLCGPPGVGKTLTAEAGRRSPSTCRAHSWLYLKKQNN